MTAPRRPRPTTAGFTLVELMVVIAVAAIMMVVAVPSFVQYRRNAELTSTANSLLASLSAARAEAMKRQLNTLVRATDDDWTHGWTVYVDTNWDAAFNGTDVLLQTQGALPSTVVVGSNTVPSDTSHYVMFSGAGFVRKVDGSIQAIGNVQFTNGTESRYVVINASGRMRVCNPATDTSCP